MIAQPDLTPRPATTEDIDELVRLRGYLLSTGDGHYVARDPAQDAAWRHAYRGWLHRHLTGAGEQVHVAVIGDAKALVACAIAVLDERAPTAHSLNGRVGWVQTVVVEPRWRRHGLGARVMNHVISWLRGQEASGVVLQTTADGAALYRKLGFLPTGEDLLALDVRGG
ncbi:GNAT family N-acetyltransferase [Streptomyces sp. NPDC049585]|uniref:GNAT family N-acetyltransferase n=1 Tax=Streptomyces sp. NPDC049585 TaxID=3155154 RepID=UPI003418AFCB